ncbi:MAG TPA: DUF1223 domain-containing protein [Vicinamibacterales bacterium]|jgi:hypothetical protein|nr:DUF1223 domain-containing protein [Vicinamibacterales bacterium]
MRALIVSGMFGAVSLAAMAVPFARSNGPSAGPPLRHVVVAELFTSEGCSSCPPADALLRHIAESSPVEGVDIIALEEHVDYWDNLGWRDPFSSAALTRRQSDYSDRVFRSGEIYTPQLVVDGTFEAIGSDDRAVHDAIVRAASHPAADVGVRSAVSDGRDHIEVSVQIPESIETRKPADIYVALVEDGLTTRVERGENHGRTLPHFAVVRALQPAGSIQPGTRTAAAVADVQLDRTWQPSHLRAVAFVQERNTLHILGAAQGR